MRASQKRALKKAAKAGISGIGGILGLILKVIGTLLLVFVTTGVIFAVIFVTYIRTNIIPQK